jgi:hypothetical protein
MGRTNWPAIIIGGGVLVGGVILWINWKKYCPDILGVENCTGDNPIADIYNQLPTIADNPTTSNYRSTRINTNPNAQANAAAKLAAQRDFSPGSANTKAAQTQLRSMGYLGADNKPKVTSTSSNQAKNDAYCAGAFCKSYPSQCPKCSDGKWVGYTNFHSFNTITLNKLSVR